MVTALAYLWDLSSSGSANSFYAAAVQAGTKSWKAFFFGSLDSSSFITVDKPPAALWVMALSGRLFGFSSWSMLVPQALEGVAAVWLLFCGVRRWFGTGAGFAAGLMLAVTPVAALMFRFNNPDALLVLLMVAGAYCLVRAVERASTKWVLAAGTMIGFAFLAKMAQAFLVVPAFALVYMVAAPAPLRRRTGQMLAGGTAIILSAGWWVAIVALWPAGSRPMIDGSADNSILNLITGYNGLGRIFGSSGPGGGGGGANFSGSTGVLRLFNDLMGGQASWLLPAALLALAAGLWSRRREPRTDRVRAALLLWGGWLVVSGLVFSLGSGVIHTYYTVALAPAIAALVAIGAKLAWDRRESRLTIGVTALGVAVTTGWAWALLDRTPTWTPWLRAVVVVAGAVAVLALLACALRRSLARRLIVPAIVLATVASLAGPVAYSASTISTAHTGSTPTAGPSSASGRLGGMGGGAPGARGRVLHERGPGPRSDRQRRALSLGGRHLGLAIGGLARAVHRRRAGDGDRRLQRARRQPDPAAVQGVRRPRRDPLLHRVRQRDGRRGPGVLGPRWELRPRPAGERLAIGPGERPAAHRRGARRRTDRRWRPRRHVDVEHRDHDLGQGPLQEGHDRRPDDVRPHPARELNDRPRTDAAPETSTSAGGRTFSRGGTPHKLSEYRARS